MTPPGAPSSPGPAAGPRHCDPSQYDPASRAIIIERIQSAPCHDWLLASGVVLRNSRGPPFVLPLDCWLRVLLINSTGLPAPLPTTLCQELSWAPITTADHSPLPRSSREGTPQPACSAGRSSWEVVLQPGVGQVQWRLHPLLHRSLPLLLMKNPLNWLKPLLGQVQRLFLLQLLLELGPGGGHRWTGGGPGGLHGC
jgi:hypothetical protein